MEKIGFKLIEKEDLWEKSPFQVEITFLNSRCALINFGAVFKPKMDTSLFFGFVVVNAVNEWN